MSRSKRRRIDGDKVRQIRDARRLNQNELAEKAGVAPHTIMRIEIGRTPAPRRPTILAIAKALEVHPDALKPPEDLDPTSQYAKPAARLEDQEEPAKSAGTVPANWIGERVRARMEADEEVYGTLLHETTHGVIIDRQGPREKGPCFYSWRIVQWMFPIDQQTSS